MTPAFTDRFRASYGPHVPDHSKCCTMVLRGWLGDRQCVYRNGHGPHGAYCWQHRPDKITAKLAANGARRVLGRGENRA